MAFLAPVAFFVAVLVACADIARAQARDGRLTIDGRRANRRDPLLSRDVRGGEPCGGRYSERHRDAARASYIGYSGVLTSPFLRQPRDVTNPRRIDCGVNFGF